jgi:hypothetical protein
VPFACQNLRGLTENNGESTADRHEPEPSSTAGQYGGSDQKTGASQAEGASHAGASAVAET